VVPAGNDGPASATVSSPGSDPVLLTVGASDGTAVADWSSRGLPGSSKPDLVAPGAHLISAGVPGSVIWNEHATAQRDGNRFVGSGTSFSTALVSGAAAALLAEHADLFPDYVKAFVRHTASSVPGPRIASGAGALDLAALSSTKLPGSASSNGNGKDGAGDPSTDASSWAASSWAARQWSARQWSARQWSAADWTARQWAAEDWTARQWSARQWSARQWSAEDWSARQWSARQWSARQWTADDWSARQWTARQWTARQWTDRAWE